METKENNMPKVSVIVSVYNKENYIQETIDSALNQTFKDFEVIAVDDGSTDKSREILESYGDKIIRVYQRNGCPPATMNAGAKVARGKYLAILDGDDVWLPRFLEKQVAVLEARNDLAFVCSAVDFIDHKGDYLRSSVAGAKREKSFLSLLSDNFVWHSSVLLRKSFFDAAGGYDTRLFSPYDFDLWLRLTKQHPFEYNPEILVKYRQHAGGISKKLQENLDEHIIIYNKPEIVSGLNLFQKSKFKSLVYYRYAMLFARAKQYLSAANCYGSAIATCPLVGVYFYTHETQRMRHSLPYRLLKPYFMPCYYLLKLLNQRIKKIKE